MNVVLGGFFRKLKATCEWFAVHINSGFGRHCQYNFIFSIHTEMKHLENHDGMIIDQHHFIRGVLKKGAVSSKYLKDIKYDFKYVL